MSAAPDIIVIGAGLHGCSAALHLALRGCCVMVIEKNTAGRHASGVNAGGVRRQGRHLAEIPLSIASLELWHRIRDLVDDDCGFQATGHIKLAESAADMAILEERASQLRGLGFEHEEMVDQAETRRLVPAAAPHIVGGLISRRDGFADPARTTRAFKVKAESLGVVFHERTRVVGLDHRADTWVVATERGRFEAPVVVNCAGAWGDQIAGWLGEAVPLRAGGLMMIVTARVPPFNDPVVGLTSRALSFKQTAAGTVLIGGTLHTGADRDRETTRLDFARVAKSGRTVSDVFPHLRGVPVMRCWAGIEGFTPDDIPVIGPSRTAPGIFHAFGYCGHGFELGPAVGGVIAELVTQGKTNIPIAPFAIDRFAEGV